eukprot:COSAG05_NODE_3348_length_2135_cov_3.137525_1_plen_89_part_00
MSRFQSDSGKYVRELYEKHLAAEAQARENLSTWELRQLKRREAEEDAVGAAAAAGGGGGGRGGEEAHPSFQVTPSELALEGHRRHHHR